MHSNPKRGAKTIMAMTMPAMFPLSFLPSSPALATVPILSTSPYCTHLYTPLSRRTSTAAAQRAPRTATHADDVAAVLPWTRTGHAPPQHSPPPLDPIAARRAAPPRHDPARHALDHDPCPPPPETRTESRLGRASTRHRPTVVRLAVPRH
jgi:hypothetical protein